MGWGDFVKIRDIGEARENVALTNAATNLAEQIDAYILGVAALAPNNQTGTYGNGLSTFTDVAQAYTRLKEEGVDDSDLRFIGTYADKQSLGSLSSLLLLLTRSSPALTVRASRVALLASPRCSRSSFRR
jgi:hypothetical protein